MFQETLHSQQDSNLNLSSILKLVVQLKFKEVKHLHIKQPQPKCNKFIKVLFKLLVLMCTLTAHIILLIQAEENSNQL